MDAALPHLGIVNPTLGAGLLATAASLLVFAMLDSAVARRAPFDLVQLFKVLLIPLIFTVVFVSARQFKMSSLTPSLVSLAIKHEPSGEDRIDGIDLNFGLRVKGATACNIKIHSAYFKRRTLNFDNHFTSASCFEPGERFTAFVELNSGTMQIEDLIVYVRLCWESIAGRSFFREFWMKHPANLKKDDPMQFASDHEAEEFLAQANEKQAEVLAEIRSCEAIRQSTPPTPPDPASSSADPPLPPPGPASF